MDYRLLFTQRALNDLEEIIGHIAEDDELSASRLVVSQSSASGRKYAN